MLVPGKHFGFRLLVRKINNRSPDEIASNAQMTGRVQGGLRSGTAVVRGCLDSRIGPEA
jgi:hypothetical protein